MTKTLEQYVEEAVRTGNKKDLIKTNNALQLLRDLSKEKDKWIDDKFDVFSRIAAPIEEYFGGKKLGVNLCVWARYDETLATFGHVYQKEKMTETIENSLEILRKAAYDSQSCLDSSIPNEKNPACYFISPLTSNVKGMDERYGVLQITRSTPFDEFEIAVQNEVAIEIASAIQNYDSRHQASIDALTGLPNKRAALEKIKAEHRRAGRYPTDAYSLVMMDLDYFKKVNDETEGKHEQGDTTLREVSDLIRQRLRDVDFYARWGGEEFLFILPNTDSDGAKRSAERVRMAIESYKFTNIKNGTPIKMTASFGVASYSQGTDAKTILEMADNNLFAAKNTGRNRVVHSSAY